MSKYLRFWSLVIYALMVACGDAGTETGARPDTGAVPGVDLCQNTCPFADDGECDDGGPGALFAECTLGTDCGDCGPRSRGAGGDAGASDVGRPDVGELDATPALCSGPSSLDRCILLTPDECSSYSTCRRASEPRCLNDMALPPCFSLRPASCRSNLQCQFTPDGSGGGICTEVYACDATDQGSCESNRYCVWAQECDDGDGPLACSGIHDMALCERVGCDWM